MNAGPHTTPPRILDKYELLEKVGEGGMAEVYRGRHLTLNREVAVKLLHPHLSKTHRNRLRFEREAKAIEVLEHDGIPRIFDYSGLDSPVCYIVTEFVEGSTLKQLLGQHGKLPSEIAAIIAMGLCDALGFAHERQIIHRDIKPENVMVRPDGQVKLMDFGIARVIDESSMTLTGGLVGSPAYMSPEQASDLEVDLRSDIFSLGTLLYRTVTGHLPFSGSSAPVILRAIMDGEYPDPQDLEPGLAPELDGAIRKALAQDPQDRFQSADEFKQALGHMLKNVDIPAREAEVSRYFDDPEAYSLWLSEHLDVQLTKRGRELIESGNRVAAMKQFNRVLYLNEDNQEVLALIQGLHQQPRHISRYVMASMVVLVIPIGALIGLGLSHNGAWFEGEEGTNASAPELSVDQPGGRNVAIGINLLEGRQSRGPTGSQPSTSVPSGMAPPTTTAEGARQGKTTTDVENSTTSRDEVAGERAPVQKDVPHRKSRLEEARGRVRAPALTESNILPLQTTGLETTPPRESAKRSESTPGGNRHEASGTRRSEAKRGTAIAKLPRAEPRAPLAPVSIRSIPHAELFINETSYGNTVLRKDPIPLKAGIYRVRLVNPYCEEVVDEIRIKDGLPFEKLYELKPLPAMLYLRSTAPDAQVFLDDQHLGIFSGIEQPIPVRNPRDGHRLVVTLADGTTHRWTIPALDPKQAYTINMSASRGEAIPGRGSGTPTLFKDPATP